MASTVVRLWQDIRAWYGEVVPEAVAHFMMQLVFAFFTEDVGLLLGKLVTRILERTAATPERAQRYFSELFVFDLS